VHLLRVSLSGHGRFWRRYLSRSFIICFRHCHQKTKRASGFSKGFCLPVRDNCSLYAAPFSPLRFVPKRSRLNGLNCPRPANVVCATTTLRGAPVYHFGMLLLLQCAIVPTDRYRYELTRQDVGRESCNCCSHHQIYMVLMANQRFFCCIRNL